MIERNSPSWTSRSVGWTATASPNTFSTDISSSCGADNGSSWFARSTSQRLLDHRLCSTIRQWSCATIFGMRRLNRPTGVETMTDSADWTTALVSARQTLVRASTAERVADILRDMVMEGRVLPGAKLAEDSIADALQVSRNTLREAFRLLNHERLVVHELNRGVFVRLLTEADVVDIYRMRRTLEGAALRFWGESADAGRAAAVSHVRSAVTTGVAAAERGDWDGVGTANMHFHRSIAALADSTRIDEIMRQLLAELRLVFHVMPTVRDFYEPYLGDNERIATLVEAGRSEEAVAVLLDYLDRAEDQLLREFASKAGRRSAQADPAST
ncbi:GntR family transcriptional regulator [Nocardioides sp.]|uniref:GntR family transcriptional regulator n=1 Tax=Nocardioides sp. TaxID=35761 RepID=UPI003436B7DF